MSSQWGPEAAPGQHSAHILLRFVLREPQSTSANFLGDVGEGGEGAGWLIRFVKIGCSRAYGTALKNRRGHCLRLFFRAARVF